MRWAVSVGKQLGHLLGQCSGRGGLGAAAVGLSAPVGLTLLIRGAALALLIRSGALALLAGALLALAPTLSKLSIQSGSFSSGIRGSFSSRIRAAAPHRTFTSR
jgi:hypothetical protein